MTLSRKSGDATLSVIVLSRGTRADLQRAVSILGPTLSAMRAQLILVRDEKVSPELQPYLDPPHVSYVSAPQGSPRAEMCDLAMSLVKSDIVALRDDVAIVDAEWLRAYRTPVSTPVGDVASLTPPAAVVNGVPLSEAPSIREKIVSDSHQVAPTTPADIASPLGSPRDLGTAARRASASTNL